MAKNKFEDYVIYAGQTPPPGAHPPGTTPGTEMFYIHDGIIKGAFMLCGTWLTSAPETKPEMMKQHYHDEDEYIGMIGYNYDKPFELGAEIEFWYEDEKFILTKSCSIFVPKGMKHCPAIIKRVDRPIFYFLCGLSERYERTLV